MHGSRRGFRPHRKPRRRGHAPSGPFNGTDVERVLSEYGWVPEVRPEPDSFAIYVHPLRPGYKVPVNPDWEGFYAGDGTFESLRRDLQVSAEELARRLSGHDA